MASEIRVDKINSLSGVGTVTLSPTGVDIAGITTAATLKATTGIVTTLTATTGIVTTFEATTGDITTLRAPTGISTHFTADKISLPDSTDGSLCIGIGSDLKLNHNGTDSYITEVGGGDLYIQGSDIIIRDAGTLEKHIEMTQNGAVDIYHNGTKKLETTSTGATLSGNLSIDANVIHNGDTDTMLSFSAANQVDIVCGGNTMGRFTTNGLALGDNKRLDIFDASGDRSGVINNADSGANSLRISADPDNTGSSSNITFHVDGTYRAKVDSNGDLTISDGDLVIGTSGHGISFAITANSSTSGATTDNELLDDYEEGGWTMTAQQGADSVTQNSANQRYTKIGNVVTVVGEVNGLVNSTSAVFTIAGLPYAVATGREGAGAAFSNNVTFPSGYNGITVYTFAGHDRLRFYVSKTGAVWSGLTGSEIGAGDIIFTATYLTN